MKNNKQKLREHFKKSRMQISIYRRKQASDECFSFLLANLPQHSKVLSFCSSEYEINIWPVNDFLMKEKRLYIPFSLEQKIYKISSYDHLTEGEFSHLEPNTDLIESSPIQEIDVILVPGLCFDHNYNRIGQGSGYYDKLIFQAKKANPLIEIWGIGFLEQMSMEKIDAQKHDMPLDQIFLF